MTRDHHVVHVVGKVGYKCKPSVCQTTDFKIDIRLLFYA